MVPEAFRETLLWIKDNCNNPEIMVVENGFCDDGKLNDEERVQYLKVKRNFSLFFDYYMSLCISSAVSSVIIKDYPL